MTILVSFFRRNHPNFRWFRTLRPLHNHFLMGSFLRGGGSECPSLWQGQTLYNQFWNICQICQIFEFFESGKFWRRLSKLWRRCILKGWSWRLMLFLITYLTTFISIIKLYNQIWQNYIFVIRAIRDLKKNASGDKKNKNYQWNNSAKFHAPTTKCSA